MFKKFFIIVLTILNVFLLYQAVGSFVLGLKTPVLFDGEYAYFMGMYLMALGYICLSILCSVIMAILIKSIKKHKKVNK